jgi:hypothetical protein
MTEYRFRHSRGYNYYIRRGNETKSVTRRFLLNHVLPFEEENPTTKLYWKRIQFFVNFKLSLIEAFATEETTVFDNCHVDKYGVEIFARKEPKPVLWRCLNPRCHGYRWKSSPRHTMGCPKCRKDKIELVKGSSGIATNNGKTGSAVVEKTEADHPRQQSFL